jgi:hypothetical protein
VIGFERAGNALVHFDPNCHVLDAKTLVQLKRDLYDPDKARIVAAPGAAGYKIGLPPVTPIIVPEM